MDRGGTSALSERRADLELKLLIPVGRVLHDREAERQLERADRRNPFETRAVAVAQAVGAVSTGARTSVMAGASYKLGADLSAEQAEYSWANHYLTRAETGFGWAPGARQVLNLTYRYTRANSALDYQPVHQPVHRIGAMAARASLRECRAGQLRHEFTSPDRGTVGFAVRRRLLVAGVSRSRNTRTRPVRRHRPAPAPVC